VIILEIDLPAFILPALVYLQNVESCDFLENLDRGFQNFHVFVLHISNFHSDLPGSREHKLVQLHESLLFSLRFSLVKWHKFRVFQLDSKDIVNEII